ncbi:protein-L-isoaspartate O-methyltransferase family protein [Sphingomonas astaxanthinifaciens]|uniref:Protein-L-isoaspartate O-methyltransferase n=1 Tax=Sphingomonas astaxanthinifaciens DSM 22298 TaxID=1123267 RepID=A0ABQ5Z6M9_9SPHN|nr:protein-L-isoaspartate O-methyltransferase [Sphingomonas astaxanthinifaciens]GLR47657.1 protein-L-isoaspartate O-methyltransferase [Sphingomonas astaxanthinifaciens DSM 22298]
MDFAAARRAMVDSQLRPQAVTDPLVVGAMASVARERFVGEEAAAAAYIDRIVPLSEGRALSPPASVGRLLTELACRPGERALVVGAGTGYSAAVLAEMGLAVTALESDPALLAALRAVPGITVVEGPLEAGAPAAGPFDVILVDGLVEHLPDALIDQLAVGGRLGAGLVEGGVARLVTGTRSVHGFGSRSIADASMAPLPGFARPPVFTF